MLLIFFHVLIGAGLKVDETKTVSKIAFGSCINQFSGNNPEIYYSISKFKPDLFVWLGDAIYADVFKFPFRYPNPNLKAWNDKFRTLKFSPEYQQLSNVSMITGIWDDHDFGINNGGKSFEQKIAAKTLYLNFLEDGSKRDHEGIYHSFSFGNLKLILLDIRWFRDDKDEHGDSLGEEQWAWLEEQLKSNEKLKIIANGLQVNTFDRYGPAEKWHEKSRIRLWQLINKYKGVIILSGDVHYAEILKVNCAKYSMVEVTASGMGHSVYTTFSWVGWFVLNFIQPFNFNVGPKYIWKNFGTIEIDWERELVDIAIRDTYGTVHNSFRVYFDELSNEIEPAAICKAGFFTLKISHFLAVLGVLGLPCALWSFGVLIYLRKYTNSY